jgi:hypothetical protein
MSHDAVETVIKRSRGALGSPDKTRTTNSSSDRAPGSTGLCRGLGTSNLGNAYPAPHTGDNRGHGTGCVDKRVGVQSGFVYIQLYRSKLHH